ncbi:hypothetical protein TWF730_003950 [Orbilia blumenaviensis]|uniref:Uncharacterized protein n=1 Tax=Orbilia blumenaviensis TaxID=1796055 RepID=A0AAV9U583_9PEZI
MQLLVTLTAAIGLASTASALRIPGADILDVPGALVRRAASACTFTLTVTESYGRSGKSATKTIFKQVESRPTGVDCGAKSACRVIIKTTTKGTPTKTTLLSTTVVEIPYCTTAGKANSEDEEEQEEEEEEEEE